MGEEKSELGAVGEEYYTTDIDGNRVLYGLTLQETQELEELKRAWWRDSTAKDGQRSYSSIAERNAARARRMELTEKHHRAWIEVMGATLALQHKPTIQ